MALSCLCQMRAAGTRPRFLGFGDPTVVLLRPRFSPQTALLWLTPAAILVIGTFTIFIVSRRRNSPEGKLTPAEQARLSQILHHGDL